MNNFMQCEEQFNVNFIKLFLAPKYSSTHLWKAEVGTPLWVQGQPNLQCLEFAQRNPVSEKQNKQNKKPQ